MALKATTHDGGFLVVEETGVSLPTTGTAYGSEIDAVKYGINADTRTNNKWVVFRVKCSAVTGTNVDINIYGAWTSGGTKATLKSAIVTAPTDGTAAVAVVDVNAEEGLAPFLYVGWTVDTDESLNTIEYQFISFPKR